MAFRGGDKECNTKLQLERKGGDRVRQQRMKHHTYCMGQQAVMAQRILFIARESQTDLHQVFI